MPLSMALREFHILKVIDKVLLNLRGIFGVSARELALNDDCSIIFLSLVNQIIRIEFKIMRLTIVSLPAFRMTWKTRRRSTTRPSST